MASCCRDATGPMRGPCCQAHTVPVTPSSTQAQPAARGGSNADAPLYQESPPDAAPKRTCDESGCLLEGIAHYHHSQDEAVRLPWCSECHQSLILLGPQPQSPDAAPAHDADLCGEDCGKPATWRSTGPTRLLYCDDCKPAFEKHKKTWPEYTGESLERIAAPPVDTAHMTAKRAAPAADAIKHVWSGSPSIGMICSQCGARTAKHEPPPLEGCTAAPAPAPDALDAALVEAENRVRHIASRWADMKGTMPPIWLGEALALARSAIADAQRIAAMRQYVPCRDCGGACGVDVAVAYHPGCKRATTDEAYREGVHDAQVRGCWPQCQDCAEWRADIEPDPDRKRDEARERELL